MPSLPITRRALVLCAATTAAAVTLPFPLRAAPITSFTLEGPNSPYLAALDAENGLATLVAGAADDHDRVRRLTHWTHQQFTHGQNMPSKPDARTILSEAKSKGEFRCTEFAQVLAAACCSVAIPARPVSLLTSDAAETGAAHVAVEAYDRKHKRWFHADGQFDMLGLEAGEPINIAQLAAALARGTATAFSGSGRSFREYAEFVTPYLFYLDVPLNGAYSPERKRASGRDELVYLPPGAVPIDHVQGWKMPAVYTRSLEEFYAPPVFA